MLLPQVFGKTIESRACEKDMLHPRRVQWLTISVRNVGIVRPALS